jgi:hypothetical protein
VSLDGGLKFTYTSRLSLKLEDPCQYSKPCLIYHPLPHHIHIRHATSIPPPLLCITDTLIIRPVPLFLSTSSRYHCRLMPHLRLECGGLLGLTICGGDTLRQNGIAVQATCDVRWSSKFRNDSFQTTSNAPCFSIGKP